MANSLLRSEARTYARTLVRDTSTANPGLSDATYNLLIAEARSEYAAMYPEQFTGDLSFGAAPTTTATQFRKTFTPTDIVRNVLNIRANLSGTIYTPLEQTGSVQEILGLIASNGTNAPPTKYFCVRTLNSDTQWDVYFYPVPDNAYNLIFTANVEPSELSSDANPVLFNYSGSRTIARMAAIKAAIILGRSADYIQNLMATLPDQIRNRMQEEVRAKGPRSSSASLG